ncbi:MAG: hypothetical protein ABTD50_19545 [Polyangiaceae bacterium]|jgi:hypothetical protein
MSIDRAHVALSLSLFLAFAAACGGAPATPATPSSAAPEASSASASATSAPAPDASAPAASAPTPSGETWSNDWPKDQQIAFMKKNVAPRLGKVFKAQDAAHYADFSCKTCHGPAYKNPHDFLPKLTLKDGKLTAFAEKPEISKFMAQSVVPEMAAAMGEPPFDPKTQKGFGCGGCHTIAKM